MPLQDFATAFRLLTGNPPFPWQKALYEQFLKDHKDNIPPACNLPTGLGKTSVIAVWLIALANGANVPRRLVYVVNRRTVVDQTTNEVENYRDKLRNAGLFDVLRGMCAAPLRGNDSPLAISTLRGQFADNRAWSADPSRPAVICGTVDMIGSRLLFSGYGVGMKARPLHAGFLGQDALLVHDEAHLEPAFQELVLTIEKEQKREREHKPLFPWPQLCVMELTATSHGTAKAFGLTADDRKNQVVRERIGATKTIHLEPIKDPKKLAEQLADKALTFADSNRAVLVFALKVDDVMKVAAKLPKNQVVTLTGTMRGKERDALVEDPIFKRFLPGGQSDNETSYLVCTSAGEVGVNISADHMVCDLTTFESMAQRFGRVNRFGKRDDTEIHVVHPDDDAFEDDEYDQRRAKTLALLRSLDGDGSPDALGQLDPAERQAAFAPPPTILPATEILFDAWALTTIKGPLPGRPPVEPYLHGLPTEWQPPETYVAWRTEVERITGDLLAEYPPTELLDAYPLKPHELLKEPSYRAFKQFEAMAKRLAGQEVPVWLVDDDGRVDVLTLADLVDKDKKDRLNGKTALLPPSAGGLAGGMLNGTAAALQEGSLDVADELFFSDPDGNPVRQRKRLWNVDPNTDPEVEDMHPAVTISLPGPEDDEEAEGDVWQWFVLGNEGDKSAKKPVLWQVHVNDVVERTQAIVERLPLDESLKRALVTAARFHDHGKRRKQFQIVLGNTKYPECLLAKSGTNGGRVKESYRHEFGSLLDVMDEPEFKKLNEDEQDLVLHLIASHHGRGRPHFAIDEAFDPERPHADTERIATEVPRRFARLQRRYGRWGLAYLESLLRAADWAASANPSEYVEVNE